MRTLDEVIIMAEHCWQPMPESLCATCPSENKTSKCRLYSDMLYYLKEYKKLDSLDVMTFTDDNLPLTWEELKQMEGKPVWMEYNIHLKNKECQDMSKTWDIIDHFGTFMDNPVFFTEKGFLFEKEKQGVQWQAYREERDEKLG